MPVETKQATDIVVTSSDKHLSIAENIVDAMIESYGDYHAFIILCEMMNMMACGTKNPVAMLESFKKTLECKIRNHSN